MRRTWICALAFIAVSTTSAAQTTRRVSLLPDGSEVTLSNFPWCDLSGDGDFAVFVASGANFCGVLSLYRTEVDTGTTIELICPIVSNTRLPSIDQDGSTVAFVSSENFFGVGSPAPQIYTVDAPFGNGNVELISVSTSGGFASGECRVPSLSGNANRVAFISAADDLTAVGVGAGEHAFLRDRAAGTIVLIDLTSAGVPANGPANNPEISGDGEWVVFTSRATNLDPTATNTAEQVYSYEVATGNVVLISKDASGVAGLVGARLPDVSDDGRFVTYFTHGVTNLPGIGPRVLLHDRDVSDDGTYDQLGDTSTIQVSVDTLGNPTQPSVNFGFPRISGDGSTVAYYVPDTIVGPNPTNTRTLVTVDLSRLQARVVHMDSNGTLGNGNAAGTAGHYNLALSSDASRICFVSVADNLDTLSMDTNGIEDVFVHDACGDRTTNLGFWKPTLTGMNPEFWICGDLGLPEPFEVRLRRATPGVLAWLQVNTVADFIFVPFFGGIFVPSLFGGSTFGPEMVDANGDATIGGMGPVGLPLYAQWVVLEPAVGFAWSISNALYVD